MLTITVEFLHDTFRASGHDDLGAAGESSAEWPPSPARLYSALIAGGGTGERCHTPVGHAGLALLESGPPVILAEPAIDELDPQLGSPPGGAIEVGLVARFAVIDARAANAVQNYPARAAQPVQPGARRSLRSNIVVYVWPDVDPTPRELEGLRHRANRVGYLGCADSPVRIRVSDQPVAESEREMSWTPDSTGDSLVSVAYPGLLDRLDDAFDAWTNRQPQRRAWIAPELVRYRAPGELERRAPSNAVWLRLGHPVSGRKVVALTETLRAALLERYDKLVAGSPDAVPAVIHGHFPEGTTGYDSVYFAALPFVDDRGASRRHGDGRIRGVCIWLPPGTDDEVVAGTRTAAESIRRLVCPSVFDVEVSVVRGRGAPLSVRASRWTGPAKTWVSVFPVVHERRTRKGVRLGDVRRWCRHAGVETEPIDFAVSKVPLVHGAARLHPREVFRPGRDRRPYEHLLVRFDEPVYGPMALGRYRHFGLGLMLPQKEDSR